MEWKSVKWLMISILLAVNIFLGVNIASKYSRSLGYEKQELKNALQLVPSEYGFSEDIFTPLPLYLYSLSGKRDYALEKSFVLGISGVWTDSAAGGGVVVYKSEPGQHIFLRRGGAVNASVQAPADEPLDYISGLLTKAGIPHSADGSIAFEAQGLPISNAALTASVSADALLFSGRVPFCTEWVRGEKSRSRGELVLALYFAMRDNGLGTLSRISTVYFLNADGPDGLTLVPAWLATCTLGTVTLSATDKNVLSTTK